MLDQSNTDGSRPPHCAAARAQTRMYPWEDELYLWARIRHNRCYWWWGQKLAGPKVWAFCWICDTKIVRWSRNYPVPYGAKTAIENHKFIHRAEQLRSGAPSQQ